jgi:hypothetical protein
VALEEAFVAVLSGVGVELGNGVMVMVGVSIGVGGRVGEEVEVEAFGITLGRSFSVSEHAIVNAKQPAMMIYRIVFIYSLPRLKLFIILFSHQLTTLFLEEFSVSISMVTSSY